VLVSYRVQESVDLIFTGRAETDAQRIQSLYIGGEMHEAEIFPAVPQTEEMAHLVQADFSSPLVIGFRIVVKEAME
jgi:hypothetical protein